MGDLVTSRREDASGGRRRHVGAQLVVVALAGVLAVVAVLLLVASFASYATVKEHLDSFASDGDADVTPADFDAIVLRLRMAAVTAAAAAIALHVGRRRL